jgi:hypothetical protein
MTDRFPRTGKAAQEHTSLGGIFKPLPALGLVLPDDTLMPVQFALDPVLKHAACLGELSNNLVATFAFSTMIG